MKKLITALMIMLIMFGCTNKRSERSSTGKSSLKMYAVDVFLNKDFFRESLLTFEKLNDCNIDLVTFQTADKLLNHVEENGNNTDIFLGLDNSLLVTVLQDSLLKQYESPQIENVNKNLIFDKSYHINPVFYSPLAFIYNKDAIEQIPSTFGAIQDGKLKQSIILTNPNNCSIGRNILIYSVAAFGRSGYRHFWRSIKNNVYTVTDNFNESYNMLLASEAPIIFGFQTSVLHDVSYKKSSRLKAVIPQEGSYNFIYGVGISSQTINIELSKKLVDYLLSISFQHLIPDSIKMFPVNTEVPLPKEMTELNKENVDFTNKFSTRWLKWKYHIWQQKWENIMLK